MATGWLTTTTINNYVDTRLTNELTNDAGAATRNETVVTELLEASKEFVQSFFACGGRYNTPLLDAEVNASVRQCQAKIFLHDVSLRRGGDIPEVVTGNFNLALATLERIRDGRQVILDTSESEANRTSLPSVAERSDTDRDLLGLMGDSRFYPLRVVI